MTDMTVTPLDLVLILAIPFLVIQLLDRCGVLIKRPARMIAVLLLLTALWVVGVRLIIARA